MKKLIVSRKLLSTFALSFAMLLPICSALSYSAANMTCEDFTTYTEVEPDDRIQKTATHVDILAKRNEDSYLYKDKGVDHFHNFEHFVNVKCVNTSEDRASAGVWGVSNDLDDVRGQRKVDNEYYVIEFYRTDPTRRIILGFWDGTKDPAQRWIIDTASFSFEYGTWYYFRIKRVGTSLTCKIYDTIASRDAESADDHLLDTLSLTVDEDDKFRYVYACCSYNLPSSPEMNLDIEGLDLREEYLADVNGDGVVDIMDVLIIGMAFGSQPGDPNWDIRADLAEEWGLIDIMDILVVGVHFGEGG